VTGLTSALLCASWIPVALGRRSLAALLVGIVVIDLAVQGLQVCSQSQIYALRPEARARVNSAYMMGFFGGGALGSALSTVAYGRWGWTGVCVVGACFGACAVLVWLVTEVRLRRGDNGCAGSSATSATTMSL
jgi:predicted MFS family arabinose efflux permease